MRGSQRCAVLASAAVIVLAAASGGQGAEPINVGFVTELTGPWSFSGSSCAAGMKLAEAEIDAAGGVLGRPLRFLVIDNLTKPGTQWTFRLEPAAVGWGYSIAKFVEQKKPGAKIAIMYSDFALMRAIA